jgi:hypothetical protein
VRTPAPQSRLRRPRQPMPAAIEKALIARGLVHAYRERPAYQQNDYLRWISQAKREETRANRADQMLAELREGGVCRGVAPCQERESVARVSAEGAARRPLARAARRRGYRG